MALDGVKAALIPHVPDILARGEYHGREECNKERDDTHEAFHFFSLAGIEVAGLVVDAGVTVIERALGEFEYRLTAYGLGHSNELRWQKRIGETLVRGQAPRVVPPIGPAEPTLDAIVEENDVDGNITILSVVPVGWSRRHARGR